MKRKFIGFHALHGIRFDKDPELWGQIVSGKLTAKDLANIQDVDIRRVAMTYLKGSDFIKEMKAGLVSEGQETIFEHLADRHIRKTESVNDQAESVTVVNRLYKIKGGEVYENDKYFLHYLNPSTREEHISFVTNHVKELGEDADACMAAKHNTDKVSFLNGLGA